MSSRLGMIIGVIFWGLLGVAALRPSAWSVVAALGLFALLLWITAHGGKLRKRGRERLLIVGAGSLAHRIADEAIASPWRGYEVVGLLDDRAEAVPNVSGRRRQVIRPMASLDRALTELRPHRIVIALSERRGRLPFRELLRAKAQGVAIDDGPEFWERLTGQVAIESITPSSLIFSRDFRKSAWTEYSSRAISIAVAIVGLVLTAPVLALIAVAVKLDSRGPIFFIQPRLGLRGERFDLVKFRTMRVDGKTSEWAGDNASRVTRLGFWLRKFRLDELPQFVNVLLGDMNLVGPRPHPVTNHALFLQNIPYYVLRCSIRPGITGWAQVRYGYADNLAEETAKMRYDLYYVKYRSVALDFGIIASTVRTVMFADPNGRRSQAKSLPATQVVLRPARVPSSSAADEMAPVAARH